MEEYKNNAQIRNLNISNTWTIYGLGGLLILYDFFYLTKILRLKAKSFHVLMFSFIFIYLASLIAEPKLFEKAGQEGVQVLNTTIKDIIQDQEHKLDKLVLEEKIQQFYSWCHIFMLDLTIVNLFGNTVYSILAFKYWVLSEKLRAIMDENGLSQTSEKQFNRKSQIIFALNMIIIVACGAVMATLNQEDLYLQKNDARIRLKIVSAVWILIAWFSFAIMCKTFQNFRGYQENEIAINRCQASFQLISFFLYTLSITVFFSFVITRYAQNTVVILTGANIANVITFTAMASVLTTLVKIADFQLQYQLVDDDTKRFNDNIIETVTDINSSMTSINHTSMQQFDTPKRHRNSGLSFGQNIRQQNSRSFSLKDDEFNMLRNLMNINDNGSNRVPGGSIRQIRDRLSLINHGE